MRRPFGWMRGALASATLALAGVVAAWAAAPVGAGWTADPDEQFVLDVNIRQLRLGDGVRAYQTPEGTCIVFGDFLTTLDVPMKIDLEARRASGWAFNEANGIDIDVRAGVAKFGGKQENIPAAAIRETPEGWCVDSASLGRWFGIGVKPSLAGSLVQLESDAKLPVELAREREQRAARLTKAAHPAAQLPKVKIPYRMWRAPALDFIVSAGATYSADTGLKVDRSLSIVAAGEIAKLSYDSLISTDNKGRPNSVRFRAYRSDPDGGLLGPLDATHFAIGDVQGVASKLLPSSSGRGFEVTNRPLVNPVAFDRTRFEGDLPPGWDAELYRNGELLGFARADGTQRYVFDDVQLQYGDNRFEIILYGPQGQQKTRYETINVGEEQVPAGKTWYSASVNQPSKSLLGDILPKSSSLPGQRSSQDYSIPDGQAAVRVEHGLDKKTSVGVLAATLLKGNERLTFVEGSVRRSLGPAIVEAAVARDNRGGMAARAQAIGHIGAVAVSADALLANDFTINGRREAHYRDARFSLDAPLKLGRQMIAAHGDVRYIERNPTDRTIDANGRLSTNINGFNLSSIVSWQHRINSSGDAPQADRVDLAMIGTGRIRKVRLRGEAIWDIAPHSQFRSAELSAYWSGSANSDWEGAVGYDAHARRGTGRLSYIRRFKAFAAATSFEAGTDGSFAAGINLNFSLDTGNKFRLTNQKLASSGSVEARIFRDLNDNGIRDPSEPLEKGVMITTGPRVSDEVSGVDGKVRVNGLAPNMPVAVGIDSSTLQDPALAPRKALQLIVPRAGVTATLDIPLVGAGDIEGALVRDDGRGWEGLEVELLDASGKVVSTTMTDYDGFFLFEHVPYGKYSMRLGAEAAKAANVSRVIDGVAAVDADHSVARIGAIRVSKVATVAAVLPGPISAN